MLRVVCKVLRFMLFLQIQMHNVICKEALDIDIRIRVKDKAWYIMDELDIAIDGKTYVEKLKEIDKDKLTDIERRIIDKYDK